MNFIKKIAEYFLVVKIIAPTNSDKFNLSLIFSDENGDHRIMNKEFTWSEIEQLSESDQSLKAFLLITEATNRFEQYSLVE